MWTALIVAGSLGIACALLSPLVVARRWAFIGEGIAHSGFGGAGTAWVLAMFFPSLDHPAITFLIIALFCLGTAGGIAAIGRRGRVNADAVIGVFLVASLAWGFLAQQLYHARTGVAPAGWEAVLFGQLSIVSQAYMFMSLALAALVALTLWGLRDQVLAYALDPLLAEVSGVPAGAIHYLLILLVALSIVVGIRVAGSVLITALLILPGATALLIGRRLWGVMALSVLLSLVACMAGPLLRLAFPGLPQGPIIVLVLVGQFLLAYGTVTAARRLRAVRADR